MRPLYRAGPHLPDRRDGGVLMPGVIRPALIVEPGDLVGEILVDAAELLLADGWCQGQAYEAVPGAPSRRCAAAAIGAAVTRRVADVDTRRRLDGACLDRMHRVVTGGAVVAWWNDKPGRTLDEVVLGLYTAAANGAAA